MGDLDGEWLEALEIDAPVDDTPTDDTSADDKPVDEISTNDKETDANSDDTSSNDDTGGDDDSDDGGGDEQEEPKAEEEPDEKATTKEAIKEALAEIDEARQTQTDNVQTFKKEVTQTLYPEGIDRQLRDSDGDPITGIDDLTKLLNPRTNELFTDEEAGSWLLSAQQKLNKDIETVERFIEQVAEVNVNVKLGAERVAEKYKDILSADDKLRERLIQAYDKTLVKDPKTGVTINNPVDVEEFFDIALESRLADRAAATEAASEAAKAKVKQDAKDSQSDRGDLKPSGKSDNIEPEDKEWAIAIKEYERGA